ncbi:hypothetical protein Pmani_020537 [Petrolisthes manimaculis]|uniref:Uncharacterized protein n=1 Tax=Petrolisthes manimaculis TaxID=1843537 RepID=A0AAE1U6G3_9EUCA|nr:hypothetical protein Pmani_020537 [Petrolisthes manimaculis]
MDDGGSGRSWRGPGRLEEYLKKPERGWNSTGWMMESVERVEEVLEEYWMGDGGSGRSWRGESVVGQEQESRQAVVREVDSLVESAGSYVLSNNDPFNSFSGPVQVSSEDNRSKNAGSLGTGRRRHNNHNNNNNNNNNNNTSNRRLHQDCNNGDIAECVELLEVLTNKDLGFAATVDELNNMCPVLLEGLQCIDNYTRRCLTQKHREYFNKLYAGTIRVIKDLCNTRGQYQEEYIRHAPCMRQVNPKYNVCSVTYHTKTAGLNHINEAEVQLSEDEKNRNVIILCCSFQEYLQCSERVVYETCGNETALFTKEFLDRMAGPIVQDLCQRYTYSLKTCRQESSSQAATQESSQHQHQTTTPSNEPNNIRRHLDRDDELTFPITSEEIQSLGEVFGSGERSLIKSPDSLSRAAPTPLPSGGKPFIPVTSRIQSPQEIRAHTESTVSDDGKVSEVEYDNAETPSTGDDSGASNGDVGRPTPSTVRSLGVQGTVAGTNVDDEAARSMHALHHTRLLLQTSDHIRPQHTTLQHQTPNHITPQQTTLQMPNYTTPQHTTPQHTTLQMPNHTTPQHTTLLMSNHTTPQHTRQQHQTAPNAFQNSRGHQWTSHSDSAGPEHEHDGGEFLVALSLTLGTNSSVPRKHIDRGLSAPSEQSSSFSSSALASSFNHSHGHKSSLGSVRHRNVTTTRWRPKELKHLRSFRPRGGRRRGIRSNNTSTSVDLEGNNSRRRHPSGAQNTIPPTARPHQRLRHRGRRFRRPHYRTGSLGHRRNPAVMNQHTSERLYNNSDPRTNHESENILKVPRRRRPHRRRHFAQSKGSNRMPPETATINHRNFTKPSSPKTPSMSAIPHIISETTSELQTTQMPEQITERSTEITSTSSSLPELSATSREHDIAEQNQTETFTSLNSEAEELLSTKKHHNTDIQIGTEPSVSPTPEPSIIRERVHTPRQHETDGDDGTLNSTTTRPEGKVRHSHHSHGDGSRGAPRRPGGRRRPMKRKRPFGRRRGGRRGHHRYRLRGQGSGGRRILPGGDRGQLARTPVTPTPTLITIHPTPTSPTESRKSHITSVLTSVNSSATITTSLTPVPPSPVTAITITPVESSVDVITTNAKSITPVTESGGEVPVTASSDLITTTTTTTVTPVALSEGLEITKSTSATLIVSLGDVVTTRPTSVVPLSSSGSLSTATSTSSITPVGSANGLSNAASTSATPITSSGGFVSTILPPATKGKPVVRKQKKILNIETIPNLNERFEDSQHEATNVDGEVMPTTTTTTTTTSQHTPGSNENPGMELLNIEEGHDSTLFSSNTNPVIVSPSPIPKTTSTTNVSTVSLPEDPTTRNPVRTQHMLVDTGVYLDNTNETPTVAEGESETNSGDKRYEEGKGTPSNEPELSPSEMLNWLLRTRLLEEVKEAVIPAPTPVPYTVRLWKEFEESRSSVTFVPLTLDILESDFIPLLDPEATIFPDHHDETLTKTVNEEVASTGLTAAVPSLEEERHTTNLSGLDGGQDSRMESTVTDTVASFEKYDKGQTAENRTLESKHVSDNTITNSSHSHTTPGASTNTTKNSVQRKINKLGESKHVTHITNFDSIITPPTVLPTLAVDSEKKHSKEKENSTNKPNSTIHSDPTSNEEGNEKSDSDNTMLPTETTQSVLELDSGTDAPDTNISGSGTNSLWEGGLSSTAIFKCTKYAPGSQVCEGASFTSHAHALHPAAHTTSLLVALLALLHSPISQTPPSPPSPLQSSPASISTLASFSNLHVCFSQPPPLPPPSPVWPLGSKQEGCVVSDVRDV